MNENINLILKERAKTYGSFETQSKLSQEIEDAFRNHDNWYLLKPYQKEALKMIANKIARIINGDANFVDSWDDIAGYAMLATNFNNE